MRPSNDFASQHQNSSNRNFSLFSCLSGLGQSQPHKIKIIHDPVTTLR